MYKFQENFSIFAFLTYVLRTQVNIPLILNTHDARVRAHAHTHTLKLKSHALRELIIAKENILLECDKPKFDF